MVAVGLTGDDVSTARRRRSVAFRIGLYSVIGYLASYPFLFCVVPMLAAGLIIAGRLRTPVGVGENRLWQAGVGLLIGSVMFSGVLFFRVSVGPPDCYPESCVISHGASGRGAALP